MNFKPCKIGFLGSDEIALPFLSNLQQNQSFTLEAVLTQPDRPAGRGRKLRPNPVKQWAITNDLKIRDPQKPGTEEVQWFKELEIEFLLVMAYGHILNSELLNVAPKGCFNLHASLLPAYRGASPIETAIAMGESETGVSLMRVVPKMDSGPVIDSEMVEISSTCTGSDLRLKLANACVPLMTRSLPVLANGNFSETDQDESRVTYCRKLKKSDGALDFSQPAEELSSRIRAFQTWPGCFFEHLGDRIKVGESQPYLEKALSPGEIRILDGGKLVVGTSSNCLEMKLLQKPGGKMIPSADFLNGYEIRGGTILDFQKSEALVS